MTEYSGPYDQVYFVLDEHGGCWGRPSVDKRMAEKMAKATGCVVVGIDVTYLYDGRPSTKSPTDRS